MRGRQAWWAEVREQGRRGWASKASEGEACSHEVGWAGRVRARSRGGRVWASGVCEAATPLDVVPDARFT